MASALIGRAPCPECEFPAAHVKRSAKCVYRYCPECAAQYHARTARQEADLLAKMRPVDAPTGTPTPTASPAPDLAPTAADPTPTPSPTASAPAPAPRRRGLFT